MAFVVKEKESSPLGISQGKKAVQSQRSAYEKKPWRNVPALSGVVETQFIRPLFSGDSLYPFRIGTPKQALIPCDKTALLSPDSMDLYPGLHKWWSKATQIWEANRSSERLSLMEQLDFQSKLSKQLPIPPFRVIYNTSGMHICSAKLRDRKAIVNSDLLLGTDALRRSRPISAQSLMLLLLRSWQGRSCLTARTSATSTSMFGNSLYQCLTRATKFTGESRNSVPMPKR